MGGSTKLCREFAIQLQNRVDICNGLDYNKNVKSLIRVIDTSFYRTHCATTYLLYFLINHASAQFYAEWEHFL